MTGSSGDIRGNLASRMGGLSKWAVWAGALYRNDACKNEMPSGLNPQRSPLVLGICY
jgi:hypothetical protein